MTAFTPAAMAALGLRADSTEPQQRKAGRKALHAGISMKGLDYSK
jgi:hypothetical protein